MAQRSGDFALRAHLRLVLDDVVGHRDARPGDEMLGVDVPLTGRAMSRRPTTQRLRTELVIVRIAAVIGVLLAVPWTVVAFTGGTFNPVSVDTDGGVLLGVAWLVIVDPVLLATVVLGVDRILRITRPRPARAERG